MDWFVIHLHISITWGELEKMLGPCPRPTNSSSLGRAQALEFGKSPPQFFCADTHGDPWPTGVQYLALPQNKGVLPAHGTAQCLRALWHRLSHLIRVRAAQSCPQLFLRFYIGGSGSDKPESGDLGARVEAECAEQACSSSLCVYSYKWLGVENWRRV